MKNIFLNTLSYQLFFLLFFIGIPSVFSADVPSMSYWAYLFDFYQKKPLEITFILIIMLLAFVAFPFTLWKTWFFYSELHKETEEDKDAQSILEDKPETHNLTEMDKLLDNYIKTGKFNYLALYNGRKYFWSKFNLDNLDEHLKLTISETTSAERYDKLSAKFSMLILNLNKLFQDLETGKLIRIVFDVEVGAVFYRHTQYKDMYLIGVTLDEKNVHECDKLMGDLINKLRKSYNLPQFENNL